MPIERLNRTVSDLWWPLILAALVLLVGAAHQIGQQVSETRQWRDLTGQTPFHSVEVSRVEVTGIEARIWGQLVKHRCEKVGHVAYTQARLGALRVAEFRSEESPSSPRNRPPSDQPQEFGPWVITSNILAPEWASFWVLHDCPEGPQFNRVFRIEWRNLRGEKSSPEIRPANMKGKSQ